MKARTPWIAAAVFLGGFSVVFTGLILGTSNSSLSLVDSEPEEISAVPPAPESILPPPSIQQPDPDPVISDGSVTVNEFEVPYIEANKPVDGTTNVVQARQQTVLFLHGAKFNETNWADTGVLNDVAAQDIRAIAVRLPKTGEPPKFTVPAEIDPGAFLKETIDALEIDTRDLVVVSPSFSGFYSLDMLVDFPSMELGGYVPIAPKNVENLVELPGWQMSNIPTMIMWADNDNRIPTNDEAKGAEALQDKMPSSAVNFVESDEHAFYFTDPALTEAFTSELLNFLQSVNNVPAFEDAA